MNIESWLEEIANSDWRVFVKRLSANDTGATGAHQVGVYIPKAVLGEVFPTLDNTATANPDVCFPATVDSHDLQEQELRAIYYNQKTRNEKRITRWATGVDYTPLQDPENTGALALFAFLKHGSGDAQYLRVWVCQGLDEEMLVEAHLGEVDPQSTRFGPGDQIFGGMTSDVSPLSVAYPAIWSDHFPSGRDVIQFLFERHFHAELGVDKRLLKRRETEFELFLAVEKDHVMPLLRNGFDDVESFISIANSISNRRKSRSGRSLEIHLEYIFQEEGLNRFGTQCVTEGHKKPDFLFPDCDSYKDRSFPDSKLRMLAVKTTVKDRWRQILNEANRITESHLFTLQQGVSLNQFEEMKQERVKLVVPQPLHDSFPKEIRGELLSLESFIRETRELVR